MYIKILYNHLLILLKILKKKILEHLSAYFSHDWVYLDDKQDSGQFHWMRVKVGPPALSKMHQPSVISNSDVALPTPFPILIHLQYKSKLQVHIPQFITIADFPAS